MRPLRPDALLTPATLPNCYHAEGPVYSSRWLGPRWVDMLAGDICELRPDGSTQRRHVEGVAAFLRPRHGAGFVVVGEHRVWLSDADDLEADLRPGPAFLHDASIRMNEGGCDPDGNLYAGSMAYDKGPGRASLWRMDAKLQITEVLSGLTVSNGIGWSPDHRHAYFVDTLTNRVDVFDWSSTEGLHDRRPFVNVHRPDGLTVDADGGVWVASIGGSAVHRFGPDGHAEGTLDLPVTRVTALTFAGPDLDVLVVTTSRHGLEAGQQPLAGAVFSCRPGPVGLPALEFAG